MMKREDILAVYKAGPDAVVDLVQSLFAIIEKQAAQIAELQTRVTVLENQLKQNSRNSSKPPSSDGFKRPPKTKSLRIPGTKPSGGQPGHPGSTLRMSETPDHVVLHSLHVCKCGCSLTGEAVLRMEKRQVVDLPVMRTEVTEHQAEVKLCPSCRRTIKAAFPLEVTAPVQYSSRFKSIGIYLSQYQLLPYERIGELMEHVFGHRSSEATMLQASEQLYQQLATVEGEIADHLAQSAVAHFDETGLRVQGKLQWCHVVSTDRFTHYTVHPKRGVDAMEDAGILPRFQGTAVHDAWGSYFQYANCHHALCNAHLLRELTYLHEQEKKEWAKAMIDLLLDMYRYVYTQRENEQPPSVTKITDYAARYDRIVQEGFDEEARITASNPAPAPKRGRIKQSKTKNLLDRLQEHRLDVLNFLCDPSVPFDNNQAERDIRMVKVQQKISGTFRSELGAKIFCRIRGFLSTAKKSAYSVMDAIHQALLGQPPLFT